TVHLSLQRSTHDCLQIQCREKEKIKQMPFEVESVHFGEVKIIRTIEFPDDRGYFMEVYRQDSFAELGITQAPFVQDNHSRSTRGVVRGLHFQYDPPMAKLMRVTVGTALLVAVDIRKGSPTLGQ